MSLEQLEDEDVVLFLKNNSFSRLSLEQKLKIKSKLSESKPNLDLKEKDGKTTRKFQCKCHLH